MCLLLKAPLRKGRYHYIGVCFVSCQNSLLHLTYKIKDFVDPKRKERNEVKQRLFDKKKLFE